jgi:thiamine-phosphate pyrophosphorylase
MSKSEKYKQNISKYLKVYFVTDPKLTLNRQIEKIIKEALKAGITFLQLRNKEASDADLYLQAKRIKLMTDKHNIPFVINDRIDLAAAVDADGVHLGWDDLPIREARKILGPDKIVGISATIMQEAVEAKSQGADYLGIGPVFSTQTKKEAPEGIGLNAVEEIKKEVGLPAVAIGSVKTSNLQKVLSTGVDGVAVVTAISQSDNIFGDIRKMLNHFNFPDSKI